MAPYLAYLTDPARERRGRGMPLRAFADRRRKYLLDHPESRTLTP